MAGHNKWSKIRRQKAILDTKKGKIFTKMSRQIILAASQGGSNPADNFTLRVAIQNAKAVNMPKENILRAIKKGTREGGEGLYKRVSYEGYASHGVAIFIEAMTDNINRTVAYVRSILQKNGGSLDKKGAIGHLFDYRGVFVFRREVAEDWDAVVLELIEEGVIDMEEGEDFVFFVSEGRDFYRVQRAFEVRGLVMEESERKYIPRTLVTLDGDRAGGVQRVIAALEELDDVQRVYHNLAP